MPPSYCNRDGLLIARGVVSVRARTVYDVKTQPLGALCRNMQRC